MKKFNLKEFQGERIEKSIANHPNVRKLWNWNASKSLYESAGKNPYIARRKVLINEQWRTSKKCFPNLESAYVWLNSSADEAEKEEFFNYDSPSFNEISAKYARDKFPKMRASSVELYTRFLKSNYFKFLENFKVREITPRIVDKWIDYLKMLPGKDNRIGFRPQFELFKAILNYYGSFDDSYISPIKKRHLENIIVKPKNFKNRELMESDFVIFANELSKFKNGLALCTLATIQYYQALRISEAAAVSKNDFVLDANNPENSRLRITKSVLYNSKKEAVEIQDGFKNSTSNFGIKEQPLFYKTYKKVMEFLNKDNLNPKLLFTHDDGKPFDYRYIEGYYNRAFKKANLNFSGTHILRHGGGRRLFDSTNGDWGAVKQLLGNSDMKSVMVYAKRSSKALTDVSKAQWRNEEK
jgi:integrase